MAQKQDEDVAYECVLHHPKITEDEREVNSEKKRIFHSIILFSCFLALGLIRTTQGPSLIDLKDQANIDLKDFKVIFLLGTVSFPLGNFLASFLIEFYSSSPMLLMALISTVLAILHASMAFSNSFATLTASSVSSEFVMGTMDTGCNVVCLQLWGDTNKEGPFFTALHFLFGIGNVLGPFVVELFLGRSERSASNFAGLTDLQEMHVCIGFGLLTIALFFLVAFGFKLPTKDKSRNNRLKRNRPSRHHEVILLALMTLFFCVANGINMAFSNFITVFAIRSKLGLTKSFGARVTSAYFAASCLMKFLSIFLVNKVRIVLLILVNLSCLLCGCIVMLFFGESNQTCFLSGAILVGLGISSLFSSGVVWLGETVEVSCRMTTLFLVATSVGAQCFKIPIAGWIEETPMSLVYSLCFGAVLGAVLFCGSGLVARSVKGFPELKLESGEEMSGESSI